MQRWSVAFLRRSVVAGVLMGVASLAWAAPNKVALLVGVGQYPDRDNRLEGPAHDVEAMRQVLVQRWGYAPEAVQTLVDQAATRQAIKQALSGLMQRTQAGDEVLIYFSGHGTSALDPALGLPLPHGSGAFIPVDANLSHPNPVSQLLVGRTDLRPVFEQLDQGGRKVWFVSDSCFSGQQVRSMGQGLKSRMIPLPMGQQNAMHDAARQRFQQAAGKRDDWPYQHVVFLAAAAEGEAAKDIPAAFVKTYPTVDGKPHGALTDALLRVLKGDWPVDADGDGQATLHEVHQAVGRFMAQRAYGHTPQRLPAVQDDAKAAGQRAVLTGKGVVGLPPQQQNKAFGVAVGASVPAELRQRLQAIPGLQLVGGDAAPNLRVELSKDGQFTQILTQGGDLIGRAAKNNVGELVGSIQQLAWVERMDALAMQGRRGVLPADIAPAALGGNFKVGDNLHFVVRPDREAYLLLLNVDSSGKVSVLYPHQSSELGALRAGVARAIPGDQPDQRIMVTEPVGTDVQLLLAFDRAPANLARWVGQEGIPPGDPRLVELERMVQSAKGQLTYARTELRVHPAGRTP